MRNEFADINFDDINLGHQGTTGRTFDATASRTAWRERFTRPDINLGRVGNIARPMTTAFWEHRSEVVGFVAGGTARAMTRTALAAGAGIGVSMIAGFAASSSTEIAKEVTQNVISHWHQKDSSNSTWRERQAIAFKDVFGLNYKKVAWEGGKGLVFGAIGFGAVEVLSETGFGKAVGEKIAGLGTNIQGISRGIHGLPILGGIGDAIDYAGTMYHDAITNNPLVQTAVAAEAPQAEAPRAEASRGPWVRPEAVPNDGNYYLANHDCEVGIIPQTDVPGSSLRGAMEWKWFQSHFFDMHSLNDLSQITNTPMDQLGTQEGINKALNMLDPHTHHYLYDAMRENIQLSQTHDNEIINLMVHTMKETQSSLNYDPFHAVLDSQGRPTDFLMEHFREKYVPYRMLTPLEVRAFLAQLSSSGTVFPSFMTDEEKYELWNEIIRKSRVAGIEVGT